MKKEKTKLSKEKAKQLRRKIFTGIIAGIMAVLMLLAVASTCIYYVIN